MKKERLIGLSDGCLAIIITLMVLAIETPSGGKLEDLVRLTPIFLIYVLSFLVIAIHWVNHHHLFQVASKVNDKILWANFNFIFWISLLPFATRWLGEHEFSMKIPMMFYALSMFLVGLSYKILVKSVMNSEGEESAFSQAFKNDLKGWLTNIFNFIAIILACFVPYAAFILLVIVKLSWFIPGKRIRKIYELEKNNIE